jgi:hypothetical protein
MRPRVRKKFNTALFRHLGFSETQILSLADLVWLKTSAQ